MSAAIKWVEAATFWREYRKLNCEVDAAAVLFRLVGFLFSLSVCLLVTFMATFRETPNLLAEACFKDIIDEVEFIFLYDLNSSKNVDFPYDDYGRFDFEEMDDLEC